MSDFKIQFEIFEGPMDLLLFLVKKQEVDIYDVNMTELASQFLQYIEVMKTLDLDLAGEFIVMASTLMYIKSRELLPVDQQVEYENEEDIEDPRWELIRKLVEYKRFKDVTVDLQKLEFDQEKVYTRLPGSIPLDPLPMDNRLEASIFDLIGAVDRVLQQFFYREAAKRALLLHDKKTAEALCQPLQLNQKYSLQGDYPLATDLKGYSREDVCKLSPDQIPAFADQQ